MRDNVKPGGKFGSKSALAAGVAVALGLQGAWEIECRDKFGMLKWSEEITNLVTNEGESYMLRVGLAGEAAISTWYLGLTDGTPTVAETDTMASHPGWNEVVAYSEAGRVQWVSGPESNQSIDNSASPADFSINANSTTVGGAFLTSATTKGGVTGTLYAVGAFSGGDRSVDSGDTLSVTATFTAGGA